MISPSQFNISRTYGFLANVSTTGVPCMLYFILRLCPFSATDPAIWAPLPANHMASLPQITYFRVNSLPADTLYPFILSVWSNVTRIRAPKLVLPSHEPCKVAFMASASSDSGHSTGTGAESISICRAATLNLSASSIQADARGVQQVPNFFACDNVISSPPTVQKWYILVKLSDDVTQQTLSFYFVGFNTLHF